MVTMLLMMGMMMMINCYGDNGDYADNCYVDDYDDDYDDYGDDAGDGCDVGAYGGARYDDDCYITPAATAVVVATFVFLFV